MLPEDQAHYAPEAARLKDGRTVTLRFLKRDDAEKLGDFFISIERAAYRFYCPHPLTRQEGHYKAADALAPTSVRLVAESETGKIVGYATYKWEPGNDRPGTLGICLRQPYRGLGLGQRMIARLCEVAEDVGPPVMSLTVQKANVGALALYRKMGFRIVREQRRGPVAEFPPEPEYYMERPAR
jgi:ribosomal protein S18 acetylase RimI-like enzyme